jgi:hypothetical protein
MMEELGDLLLQVVFHAQLARERRAFDFDQICRRITDKLIRRHPHVFGNSEARTVDAVWAQWEQIKAAEKQGTRHHRPSALDGIPRHLPALLRAEKLVKKARKAKLLAPPAGGSRGGSTAQARGRTAAATGRLLFELAAQAQGRGWSAEELLRAESVRRERAWRKKETQEASRKN